MRYKFINAERAKDNTARLCELFGISRSGFYAWRSRPISKRAREDVVLLDHIQNEFEASHRSYGRPRMVEELRELGFIWPWCWTFIHGKLLDGRSVTG